MGILPIDCDVTKTSPLASYDWNVKNEITRAKDGIYIKTWQERTSLEMGLPFMHSSFHFTVPHLN